MALRLALYLPTIRKALAAAASAGVAALAASMLDGDLTSPELVVAAGMALAGGLTVWSTPANRTPGRHRLHPRDQK